jgi:hypothetical protein
MPYKNEIVALFQDLLLDAQGHNKSAYKFGLLLANNLPQDVEFDIRKTKNGAYNIGDLGEVAVKYNIDEQGYITWSRANRNDIDRKNLNEIKTFPSANRNPNGLKNPQGFIAVSKYGIHHITKNLVEKYWEQFKDNKGLKEPTLQILKQMIENDNPKLLKKLNQQVLGG